MTLEVIAFNIESCALIEKAGGGRIELCANPPEGGTTVSMGMMKAARKAVSIPIFPIIRPRGGDFLYNDEEYTIIQDDIRLAKETGMDGVVIGLLNVDGTVDKSRTARLVELAYPMEVTFHRAFDRTPDPVQALEDVIQCGCNRILTSGLADTALQGLEMLQQLVKAADQRIIILPGSGIRSGNIRQLATATGLQEFHTSARTTLFSRMSYENPGMQESQNSFTVDPAEITACVEALSGAGHLLFRNHSGSGN
jgi:copper homeostasis protein